MREYDNAGIRASEVNPADRVDRGTLQILINTRQQNRPVEDARVSISYTGNPEQIIEELRTDSSGRTPEAELPAPPLEYSMEPGVNQPYSEYTLQISAPGFAPVEVSGSELLPGQLSRQPVLLDPLSPQEPYEDIVIPAHTLYGDYPEKILRMKSSPRMNPGKSS